MKEIGGVALYSQAVSEKKSDLTSPKFGIRMQYKSADRTIELPLKPDMVGRLAIEAEFRNMRIGEFAQLILTIVEKDLFQLVLEPAANGHKCEISSD